MQTLQDVSGAARDAAERIRNRTARYAAIPVGDIAESVELLIAATVRYAEHGDSSRADQHLRRLLALRAAQEVTPADLRQALKELRMMTLSLGPELTTATHEELEKASRFVEARALELFDRMR